MRILQFVNRVFARVRFGSRQSRETRRLTLAQRYLAGSGIEIGALDKPLAVLPDVSVKYVDRLPVSELIHHYPEIESDNMVQVDILAVADDMEAISDESQDFIIASHLLEHCEDPIRAIASWIRVLRDRGTVFLAIPNKHLTFDQSRRATSWSHVLQDWVNGPKSSRESHYLEWVRLVEKAPDREVFERVTQLMDSRYSIHFHVWHTSGFKTFLKRSASLMDHAFELVRFVPNGDENLAILRKTRNVDSG